MTENFTAPEGWVATEISEDVIVLKRKDEPKEEPKEQRSKTWEEFCERHNLEIGEAYIGDTGIVSVKGENRSDHYDSQRYYDMDRNYVPERYAKPMLALMQLLTIREKEYIPEGWMPQMDTYWHSITYNPFEGIHSTYGDQGLPLSFPTLELADEFLDTWKGLIEEAKILL